MRTSAVLGGLFFAARLFAQTPDLPALKEVPLLDCSGLPCVDLTAADGKTLRLLIDTGNANAYLNRKALAGMNLETKPMLGADGKPIEEMQETVVPGAKLGDVAMGDFPFVILDAEEVKDNGKKAVALPGDGALTYNSFKNRIVQLDFPKHLLRISEPLSAVQPCPIECADLAIRHFGNFGPPSITTTAFAVNGQPLQAQINTLFTGSMLIYPPAVQRLDLKKESKSKQKDDFPFTDDGIKLIRFDSGSIVFGKLTLTASGPLYFTTAEAHTPDDLFDATAGLALFAHSVLTLDFKDMKIWVQ